MTELEKFRDISVQQSLFKFSAGEDVPMSMLRHWDSNAYYNFEMARLILGIGFYLMTFPESLSQKLEGHIAKLPLYNAGIDDHRATMAVEALGKSTFVGQQQTEEKKKGIFGFLKK